MNYFLEITKKLETFCNIQPYPDSRLEYLKSANEISKLYLEANALAEDDTKDVDNRLLEIYNRMSEIIG